MPTADPNERSLPGASLRSTGHNLDLIRDGRPRGGRKVGQYAPQNFPPKPSPLPNETQWSEMCVNRPVAVASPPDPLAIRIHHCASYPSGDAGSFILESAAVILRTTRALTFFFFRDSSSLARRPADAFDPPLFRDPQGHEAHPHASFDEPVGAR